MKKNIVKCNPQQHILQKTLRPKNRVTKLGLIVMCLHSHLSLFFFKLTASIEVPNINTLNKDEAAAVT